MGDIGVSLGGGLGEWVRGLRMGSERRLAYVGGQLRGILWRRVRTTVGSSRGADTSLRVLLEFEVHGFCSDGGAQGQSGGLRHGEYVPDGFLLRVQDGDFEGAELVHPADCARLGHTGLERCQYMIFESPPA